MVDTTHTTGTAVGHPVRATAPDKLRNMQVITARHRVKKWLAGKADTTAKGYWRDLVAFAEHLEVFDAVGKGDAGRALTYMCNLRELGKENEAGEPLEPAAIATLILEEWRDEMKAPTEANPEGMTSSTINRRLSAVNSALREIYKAGMGPGRVQVTLVKRETRGDIKGPKVNRVTTALDALAEKETPVAVRDLAIALLAVQRGLRRSEIANLRIEDVNLDDCKISVLRKGNRERVEIDIAGATCEVLAEWLDARRDLILDWCASAAKALAIEVGDDFVDGVNLSGSVFVGMGPRDRGAPLTGNGIYRVVQRIGKLVGAEGWRPHKLRHTAITEALRVSNGNLEAAREFAGHADVSTTSGYIDDGDELQRDVVRKMAGSFEIARRT